MAVMAYLLFSNVGQATSFVAKENTRHGYPNRGGRDTKGRPTTRGRTLRYGSVVREIAGNRAIVLIKDRGVLNLDVEDQARVGTDTAEQELFEPRHPGAA